MDDDRLCVTRAGAICTKITNRIVGGFLFLRNNLFATYLWPAKKKWPDLVDFFLWTNLVTKLLSRRNDNRCVCWCIRSIRRRSLVRSPASQSDQFFFWCNLQSIKSHCLYLQYLIVGREFGGFDMARPVLLFVAFFCSIEIVTYKKRWTW